MDMAASPPSATGPEPRHRKWAIILWSLALLWVLTSFGCLLYALYGAHGNGAAKHVAAIVWQVGQMLAIVCFGLGIWQSQKHRRWQHQQRVLRGQAPDPWE